MYEEHHYKGFFNFYFYPTNQNKIAKQYLKEVFPLESKKQAKKISKNLNNFDAHKFLKDNETVLLNPLRFYKTDLLKEYLEKIYNDKPKEVTLFYIILNDVIKTITFATTFNIEQDLAQNILVSAINKNISEQYQ